MPKWCNRLLIWNYAVPQQTPVRMMRVFRTGEYFPAGGKDFSASTCRRFPLANCWRRAYAGSFPWGPNAGQTSDHSMRA